MGRYILVVDDSVTIRSSAEYILKEAGYHVAVATDGIDGMSKLDGIANAGDSVSMIITDVNMLKMDGITFTRRVKTSKYRPTPVLILTTETQDVKKQEGWAAGAAGWLVKPFQPEQLLTVVKKLAHN